MTDPIAPDALREAVARAISARVGFRWSDDPWAYTLAQADAILAVVAKHRDAEVERLTDRIARALAEVDETADAYAETTERMRKALWDKSPTVDFTADDVIRYGAYAATWKSAARKLRSILTGADQ